MRPAAILLALALAACAGEPRPQRQDPATPNPPTKGFIDVPGKDDVVGPLTIASGWAIDESGIQRIRIYVDDRLVATVLVTAARPDVEKMFPQYATRGAAYGWTAEVDFGEKLGYCVIRAEALDGRGALTHFAQVTVRVVP